MLKLFLMRLGCCIASAIHNACSVKLVYCCAEWEGAVSRPPPGHQATTVGNPTALPDTSPASVCSAEQAAAPCTASVTAAATAGVRSPKPGPGAGTAQHGACAAQRRPPSRTSERPGTASWQPTNCHDCATSACFLSTFSIDKPCTCGAHMRCQYCHLLPARRQDGQQVLSVFIDKS